MSDEKHPKYYVVFVWLTILTILEIGIVLVGIDPLVTILVLLVLASMKALLVARNYMHLRFEAPLLGLIAASPVLLGAFLVIAAMQDATTWP